MAKIEIEQVVRECPHNENIIKDGGSTRYLIRDFKVIIDGEYRALLSRIRYGGKGYEVRDPDYRPVKINDDRWSVASIITSQALVEPAIQLLLANGRIPTIAELNAIRAKEAADKVARKRAQRREDIKRAKERSAEALYDALLGVAKFYGWIGGGGKLSPTAERAVEVLAAADKVPVREDEQ